MDPNECLKQIREICKKFDMVNLPLERQAELGRDLREHIESLDEWLLCQGFPPVGWIRSIRPNTRTH